MAEASIPVDLVNPGQVFACLGFLEAADVLLGDAEGAFDWSDESNVRFHMRATGDRNPFATVLAFLANATLRAVVPAGSPNLTDRVPMEVLGPDDAFPFPDPDSAAALPAVLEGRVSDDGQRYRLLIEHWGDSRGQTRRDNVKFWAGMGGYPGAAIARDALDLVRAKWSDAVPDPFNCEAEQSNSFRFDWRRDYIAIDIGFSLNTHAGKIAAVGFPFVEVLAAVGLTNARPERIDTLDYRYGVIGGVPRSEGSPEPLLDPVFLRAGLGAAQLPLPRRCFRMQLGWPGKEGQARAIRTVVEEAIR